jgi:Dynein heavy chain C-terminal domain
MQEAESCNSILALIRADLHELEAGLKGDLTMSADLDTLLKVRNSQLAQHVDNIAYRLT